ncbi:MAG TPA: GDP-mannose 4,6-dehydratase [Vicinamibacterales bacterium]
MSATSAPRQTILITGAAGFAARHLIERLVTTGADIVAWYRPGGHRPPAGLDGGDRVRWQAVDLLDAAAVDRAVAEVRPRHVYHLAGATHQGRSFAEPAGVLRVNAMGTHHLLDALARHVPGARALVTSTGFVYQPRDTALDEAAPLRPPSPYALSKLAQELIARHAGQTTAVEVIVCRPFNHIGPGQSADFFAASFARQIAAIVKGQASPVLRVGNLSARRDLTDVRDVVRAYVSLMAHGTPGEVYNVCSGRAYAVREVLDGLIAQSGVKVDVQVDPNLLRPVDQPLLLGRCDKVREAVGWVPEIPLEQTLRDVLADWRDREG